MPLPALPNVHPGAYVDPSAQVIGEVMGPGVALVDSADSVAELCGKLTV